MADQQQTRRVRPELLNAVRHTLAALAESGSEISFSALAERVGVARSTLYRNLAVRELVATARQKVVVDASDILAIRRELVDLRGLLEDLRARLPLDLSAHRGATTRAGAESGLPRPGEVPR